MHGAPLHGKRETGSQAQDALRQKLPRLNSACQKLANLFYGPRSVSELTANERRLTWQWRYQPQAPAAELVRLSSQQGDAWIAIDRDHGFSADAAIDWRSLQDDARLLAWSLAYEPLVLHLRALLGLAVEPAAIVTAGEVALGPAHCSLAFAIQDANGAPVLSGTVSFHPDLIAADSIIAGSPALQTARVEKLPVPFRVIIAEVSVEDAELRSLEHGDVICLGTAEKIRAGAYMSFESTDQSMRIAVRIGAAAARVEAFEVGLTNKRSSMPSHAEDSQPLTAQVDALPVTLSFEAGEILLTVAELKALAPGAMLSFGRKLTDSPVTIRANGRVLGTGELVLIDDFLGVRMTELRDHGSQ